jgi:hypothetical protein
MRQSRLEKFMDRAKYLARSQPQKVLFEHVPKCGGTTILGYLISQYEMDTIFNIDGSNPSKSIDYFMSLPERERYSFHLIQGHGAHRLLRYADPETKRATILRDPVDRIISHYYYVLRNPSHYLYSDVTTKGMSLLDYATSNLSSELCNDYVCRFLQISAKEAEGNPDETVFRAFDTLQKDFDVIGTVDNLNSAMQSLARIALFRTKFKDGKLNATADRPKLSEIDPETRLAIAEVNHLDVRLYKLIKENLV